MPSSNRFPPIKPSDLTPEQEEAHDHMSTVASKFFGDTSVHPFLLYPHQTHLLHSFTYKNSDGAFIGPFAPLLYTPSLCKPYFDLVEALTKISSSNLPAVARETAILATGSRYESAYEIYAHERVALKSTSLTREQIGQIKSGGKPEGLGEEASVAFDATMDLVGGKGNLGCMLILVCC
ncbi:uncharacterized protein LY89DRAFT_761561 [Mollisia scopiformis]|uniref:Carboxymuconolactone decarboxylase-like domain-containing protein n=1 Tax=Mollisia scopiformis TaxID=149040 RepID=A0A132BBP2_MOLSC|nr:uncharacterized protein LY89DRAFT_761561 [Mollisia scopiformis]KUJ09816.1 hypothetical protein LY89DRAFT_761561 [Mollisia scopiformis]